MIHIGQYNTLTILRFTPPGAYLGDEDGEVVLLPNKYLTEDMEVDQQIEVFVYLDSHERIVSTTLRPKIELNTFGYLRVNATSHIGAFLDWGLEKDLFVPFKEQTIKMEEGKSYLVYLYLDDSTQRLVASARIRRYFETERIVLNELDEVDLLIGETSELGKNVIVNDTYSGLIYKNDIVKTIRRGDRCKGYVIKVREDGKLDIALEKPGFQKIEPNSDLIMEYLKSHDGVLNLHDKSDPDEIRDILGMSKKTFKQAIGILYKKRLIEIKATSIELSY